MVRKPTTLINSDKMNENSFDENVFKAITALNALMTDTTVSKSSKAVVKINRFKNWLNELWDANKTDTDNEPTDAPDTNENK